MNGKKTISAVLGAAMVLSMCITPVSTFAEEVTEGTQKTGVVQWVKNHVKETAIAGTILLASTLGIIRYDRARKSTRAEVRAKADELTLEAILLNWDEITEKTAKERDEAKIQAAAAEYKKALDMLQMLKEKHSPDMDELKKADELCQCAYSNLMAAEMGLTLKQYESCMERIHGYMRGAIKTSTITIPFKKRATETGTEDIEVSVTEIEPSATVMSASINLVSSRVVKGRWEDFLQENPMLEAITNAWKEFLEKAKAKADMEQVRKARTDYRLAIEEFQKALREHRQGSDELQEAERQCKCVGAVYRAAQYGLTEKQVDEYRVYENALLAFFRREILVEDMPLPGGVRLKPVKNASGNE